MLHHSPTSHPHPVVLLFAASVVSPAPSRVVPGVHMVPSLVWLAAFLYL